MPTSSSPCSPGSSRRRDSPSSSARGRAIAAETAREVRDQAARIAFGLFGVSLAAERADQPSASHLLFIWAPSGGKLEQRDGEPPAVGDMVEVDGTTLVVSSLGPSPLPGDHRRCAHTQLI